MIETLSVAVAKTVMDRSAFPELQIEKFESVTGIRKTRRWEGSTMGLALKAVNADKIRILTRRPSAVIFVTQSPDRNSPAMANDIARELQLPHHIPVFDVNQSCSGFVYGVWLAEMVASKTGNVLLVCVDRLRADPDKLDSLIFSDAASACMISCDPCSEAFFYTDGEGAEKLKGDEKGLLKMDGGAVFDFVTSQIPGFLSRFKGVEILVQHQANLSMMKLVERRAGYSGRSVHSIEEFGNMSLVSIPAALALKEAEVLGKNVLLCGFGAGWSVAAMQMDWPVAPISRLVEV